MSTEPELRALQRWDGGEQAEEREMEQKCRKDKGTPATDAWVKDQYQLYTFVPSETVTHWDSCSITSSSSTDKSKKHKH